MNRAALQGQGQEGERSVSAGTNVGTVTLKDDYTNVSTVPPQGQVQEGRSAALQGQVQAGEYNGSWE